MAREQYTQETPQGVIEARIGYDMEHKCRGDLADQALRDGTWPVELSSIIFIRKFIREFCNGDDQMAIERFGVPSVEELHLKMDEKAEQVATSFGMTKEELISKFPGVYI